MSVAWKAQVPVFDPRGANTSETYTRKPRGGREDIVRVGATQTFDTVSNHSTFLINHSRRQILSRLFWFSSSVIRHGGRKSKP